MGAGQRSFKDLVDSVQTQIVSLVSLSRGDRLPRAFRSSSPVQWMWILALPRKNEQSLAHRGVWWVLLALTLTPVVPTERLLDPARGPPVPFHSVARARRPLPCHGAAGLHSACEGFHSPGCWPHCHPLQVGALGFQGDRPGCGELGWTGAGSRPIKRTGLGFSLLGDRG